VFRQVFEIIDKELVIIGSFNYTGPANLLNDENIIVIGDLVENSPIGKINQKKIR
jgi:phosphatidylserine/phosphatidylglycerophosphate/cardiolipin synthase-like enzyme